MIYAKCYWSKQLVPRPTVSISRAAVSFQFNAAGLLKIKLIVNQLDLAKA